MNKSTELLCDSLRDLHAMETLVAPSITVLSGSVMNLRLRKILTQRALRMRERREWLAGQVMENVVIRTRPKSTAIDAILATCNKELADAGNPFIRDLIMVRHCMRIEQHAAVKYGLLSRLAEIAGLPAHARCLASFLFDLEAAIIRLQAIQLELSRDGLGHCQRAAA